MADAYPKELIVDEEHLSDNDIDISSVANNCLSCIYVFDFCYHARCRM